MKGNVSGYVCNHGSPSGERDTASPRLWAMLRMQASDEEVDDVFSRSGPSVRQFDEPVLPKVIIGPV